MTAELYPTFDDFWILYNKKRGRKKSALLWNKLTHKIKCEVMEHLIDYVKSTPERQYRKDPTTYLNGECWEDEIITDNNGPISNASAFEHFSKHYNQRN